MQRSRLSGRSSLATLWAAGWLALIALTGPAPATDLSILLPARDDAVKPVSWTGFIISPSIRPETLHFEGAGSNLLRTAKGYAIGGEVGYDRQVGRLVYGIVGNLLGANVTGDASWGQTLVLRSRLDAYGLLRARIGIPYERFLLFGTVGGAFAHVEIENWTQGLRDRHTLGGIAYGGGAEWVYNSWVTLRAEYIHIELERQSFSSLPVGSRDVGASMDQIKLGIVTRY